MKTFEEAARIVLGLEKSDLVSGCPSGDTEARLRHYQFAFIEDVINSPIGKQAQELAYRMVLDIAEMSADKTDVLPTMFIHALAYGVSIGVLMEKREE